MLLRRHYGIGAGEYLETLPSWEADLLLAPFEQQTRAAPELDDELTAGPAGPADPFATVPDFLKEMPHA